MKWSHEQHSSSKFLQLTLQLLTKTSSSPSPSSKDWRISWWIISSIKLWSQLLWVSNHNSFHGFMECNSQYQTTTDVLFCNWYLEEELMWILLLWQNCFFLLNFASKFEKDFRCVVFRSTREQSTVLGDMDEDTGNGSVYPKKWIYDQGNGHKGRE